jgi:hypothetical protein
MKGGGSGTHSEDGDKVNYFDKQAAQGAAIGGGNGSTSGGSVVFGAGGSSFGGGSSNAAPSKTQNPAALAATWGPAGEPGSRFLNKIVDKVGARHAT